MQPQQPCFVETFNDEARSFRSAAAHHEDGAARTRLLVVDVEPAAERGNRTLGLAEGSMALRSHAGGVDDRVGASTALEVARGIREPDHPLGGHPGGLALQHTLSI